jgi:hypothetical protein
VFETRKQGRNGGHPRIRATLSPGAQPPRAGDGSPVARCGPRAFRCCDYVCGNWGDKSG